MDNTADFIQLTQKETNKPIYVSTNHIQLLEKSSGGTRVRLYNTSINVVETMEEILKIAYE